MNYEPFLGMNVLLSHNIIEQITALIPYVLAACGFIFFITFVLLLRLPVKKRPYMDSL